MLARTKRAPAFGLAGATALLALGACQQTKDAGTAVAVAPVQSTKAIPELARADSDMRGVLLALQALDPKPIETLSAEDARMQPSVADAVKRVLLEQGKAATPEPVSKVGNTTIPGPGGPIPIRFYRPEGKGPFPVVVYYHGGGWVIGTIDGYDASARALANEAKAIVVAVEYRKAPEHKFPAAHEDAFAAYEWVRKNAGTFGGDPKRVATVGESAGGNLAIAVSLLAKEHHVALPVHEVAIYPVAGSDMNTPSYVQNENAKPLNKAMMGWFFDKYTAKPEDARNPLIDLVDAPDLKGLPPTTVVTAEIDPLRSEGMTLVERLHAAGVPVVGMDYPGVTHEFFGMGAVVQKAKMAEDFVGERLRAAFARKAIAAKKPAAAPAKPADQPS